MPLTLHVEIDAETGEFKGALQGAEGQLDRFGKEGERAGRRLRRTFESLSRGLERAARRMALTITGATAGLFLLSRRSIATADELGKTADQIGINIESLQELRFAANRTGVDLAVFNQGLTAMVRRAGEAQRGNEEFAKAFRAVGLSAEDLRRLAPEDILREVADGLAGISNEQEKVALADRIFSEAGRRMVNLLRLQSRGFDDMAERAHRLGIILSTDTVRRAEQANDELTDMSEVFRVAGLNLGLEFMPVMRELAGIFISGEFRDGVRSAAQDLRDLIAYLVENKEVVAATTGALLGARFGAVAGLPGAVAGGLVGAVGGLELIRSETEKLNTELSLAERSLASFLELQARGAHTIGFTPIGERIAEERDRIEQIKSELRLLQSAGETIAGGGGGGGGLITTTTGAGASEGLEAMRSQLANLRFEADLLASEFPAAIQEAAAAARGAGLIETFTDLTSLTDEGRTALGAYAEEFLRLRDLRDVASIVERTKTEQQKLNDELARIEELRPHLTAEQYARALADVEGRMDELKKKHVEVTDDQQRLNDAANRFGFTFASAFEPAVITGDDLHTVFQGLLEDIERMILRLTIIEPLARSISAGLTGGGAGAGAGGGGLFGFVGSLFAAEGGVVGRDRIPTIQVPAAAFAGAPHLQGGGMIGGGVPAIVHRGEEILPPNHPRHRNNAGGGGVNVYISAPPGTRPQVERRIGPGGTVDLHVVLDEAVATAVRQPGSQTGAAISERFGVAPALIARA